MCVVSQLMVVLLQCQPCIRHGATLLTICRVFMRVTNVGGLLRAVIDYSFMAHPSIFEYSKCVSIAVVSVLVDVTMHS